MSFAGEALPAFLIGHMSPWRLVPQTTTRRTRSGSESVITLGLSYWEFDVRTPTLSEENFRAGLAFIDRREGDRVTFTAYPSPDGAPLGVADGSDASVTVDAIDIEEATATFGTVGASAAYAGDFIGYYTAAGGYWIGRIVEDQAAAAGAYTLKVRPPPLVAHATPAVKRTNPTGEFALAGAPDLAREVAERRIAFTARQVIRG